MMMNDEVLWGDVGFHSELTYKDLQKTPAPRHKFPRPCKQTKNTATKPNKSHPQTRRRGTTMKVYLLVVAVAVMSSWISHPTTTEAATATASATATTKLQEIMRVRVTYAEKNTIGIDKRTTDHTSSHSDSRPSGYVCVWPRPLWRACLGPEGGLSETRPPKI